jgi:hypothetical protein
MAALGATAAVPPAVGIVCYGPIVLKKSRLSGLGPILRNDDSIGAASLNH